MSRKVSIVVQADTESEEQSAELQLMIKDIITEALNEEGFGVIDISSEVEPAPEKEEEEQDEDEGVEKGEDEDEEEEEDDED